MAVAVIIPNLNCAQCLGRCLESVAAQTVPADEVIVVDGCSSDDSDKIVIECMVKKQPPVSWICTPPLGMANARNIGIAATKAEFIVPLDADDWIEPGYIERCVKILAWGGIGVAAPALRWPDGQVQLAKPPFTVERFLEENLLFSCSMFRRQCWQDVGGYDEYRRTYEDWDFWLRILKAGWCIEALDEPLFHYCPREGSSSHRMKPGDHEEYVRYIREKHGK